jgi:hypothetical protein
MRPSGGGKTRAAVRFALAVASAGAALVLAASIWPRPGAPSVRFVERSADEIVEIERIARAERVEGPAADTALAPLPRRPLGPEFAKLVLPLEGEDRGNVYDPDVHFRYRGHLATRTRFPEHPDGGWWLRTNSLGLKGTREVLEERPALRILVTGDSHTDGFCADEETFARLLETLLAPHVGGAVESLNAGHAGYAFYNYLGVFTRYGALAPDVFVIAVYTGNDFLESLLLRKTFAGELDIAFLSETARIREMAPDVPIGVLAQFLRQEIHFRDRPEDVEVALDTAVRAIHELAAECSARGILFVPFVLPPAPEVEPRARLAGLELAARRLGLTARDLGSSARLTDEWIARLAGAGIEVLDPRPHLRDSAEPLYWDDDWHLSVAGNARVASWLAEAILTRLAKQRRTAASLGSD